MSGIAGILSHENQNLVSKMLSAIKHRGSSDANIWKGPKAVFGTIPLGEIQEKPGPYCTPSGERVIVMDGILTNRNEMSELLVFHTMTDNSDAEICLHAFEERGTRIFGRFDGEFALAIMDNERCILARDRLGIKPLYYGFHNGSLCFASEMKALVGIADTIHEFPPGHFLVSDQGLYPFQPYFPKMIQIDGALESAEQLYNHLDEAVRRSLPNNTPIGVWLSGGVDSSVVAALAKPYVEKLYTFSSGIEGAPDLEYARQVADYLGAEHYEQIYDIEKMKSVTEKTIYHLESFDAPLVHSAISNYLVAEMAADYVPFVLSGEGGDELFAGYAYQKEYASDIQLMLSVQDAIAALHNTALQRVDRCASAHTTGVAVPFLDPDVVQYALAIPSRWKIRGPQSMEKWPLRQGLADKLPVEVIWRGKSKFWEGSGSGQLLTEHANQEVSDQEFAANRDLNGGETQLRSKEEYLYYQIFNGIFGDSIPLEEVGRTKYI